MPYPANVRSAFARQMEAEHILEKLAVATLAEWTPHATALFTAGDGSLTQASDLWRVIFTNLYGHGAAMLYGHTMARAALELGVEFPEPVPGAVVDSTPPLEPMGVDTSRLQKQAERIVKRGLGQLDEALTAAAPAAPPPFTIRQAQANYLNQATSRYAGVPDTVYKDVAKELDAGHTAGESPDEMASRVKKVIPASSAKTARMIARTESAATMTNATIAVAKVTTSTGTADLEKAWVATMDRKTRRSHYAADGQRVPVNAKFQIGRFKVDHPGDGPPEEARNCRCAVMILRAHEALPTGKTNNPNDTVLEKTEIARRAAEGNVRARDTSDGLGVDTTPPPTKPPTPSGGALGQPEEPKRGKVDRTKVPTGLKQHELDTARKIAREGFNVEFVAATGVGRTADTLVNGDRWEFKNITGAGKSTVVDALRGARGQSRKVVIHAPNTALSEAEINAQIDSYFQRYDYVQEVWVFPPGGGPSYRRLKP